MTDRAEPTQSMAAQDAAYLDRIRVLEVADELGEYCGRLLGGLGADVVKIEPLNGESTRTYGPFLDGAQDVNRSLHFWHYNVGKRSATLDLDRDSDRDTFIAIAERCDVVVTSRLESYMNDRGIGYDSLSVRNSGLVYVNISPFGNDGPWADYRGSDLIHLALGGVMMNCGYDPDPSGHYETPPIAPQMQQAYHIVGEMAAMGLLTALYHRARTGEGQRVEVDVHSAVSANTETDTPDWVYLRQPHLRQTCRHSTAATSSPAIARTKDGRWILPYSTYLRGMDDGWDKTVAVLRRHGASEAFDNSDPVMRETEAGRSNLAHAVSELTLGTMYDADLWRDGQDEGLAWAPLRLPEENLDDPHWAKRSTFRRIFHPELDRSFDYVVSRWVGSEGAWANVRRPPLLGEHNQDVEDLWPHRAEPSATGLGHHARRVSKRGQPFALDGLRVIDLSWIVASAGAGRFLSAFGAEVIKVEHESRWDGLRWGLGSVPAGGRAARDAARSPLPSIDWSSPNRSGAFMEVNAGKLGVSLNLKSPRGRSILTELLRDADVVIEGFSPETLKRLGFGWETLKQINPRLIYVQQSGLGEFGTYGRARAFGPTAQAFTGLSEMSGLPDPFPPAGIGYSYLDWFGAYNVANAVLAGLVRRESTGTGCHVDASQGEVGIYLTGTATLDKSANGGQWKRYGNRSPYKRASPHEAFRTRGEDRWIAVACFTEAEWRSLLKVLGDPSWGSDRRFATLDAREVHADELEKLINAETADRDGFTLMQQLQAARVPAGMCQTAEDRIDTDPQLRHRGWQVELEQQEIGVWPVKELPMRLSKTPSYIGGIYDRSGPSYGQDTSAVLQRVLGLSTQEISHLTEDGSL